MTPIDEFFGSKFKYTPIEISLSKGDDFLKIRESLTRIGVKQENEQKLYQTCHILHKQGRYFIMHFKELMNLDGNEEPIEDDDVARRNTISKLLEDWNLLKIVNPEDLYPLAPMSKVMVVSYKNKLHWTLEPKYVMYSDNTKLKEAA